MKIRELEHWPPQPSGSGKSFNLPLPQESMIEKVVNVINNDVHFIGTANGNEYRCRFEAPSEKVALDLKKILESSIGKSLLSIGNVDLPAN